MVRTKYTHITAFCLIFLLHSRPYSGAIGGRGVQVVVQSVESQVMYRALAEVAASSTVRSMTLGASRSSLTSAAADYLSLSTAANLSASYWNDRRLRIELDRHSTIQSALSAAKKNNSVEVFSKAIEHVRKMTAALDVSVPKLMNTKPPTSLSGWDSRVAEIRLARTQIKTIRELASYADSVKNKISELEWTRHYIAEGRSTRPLDLHLAGLTSSAICDQRLDDLARTLAIAEKLLFGGGTRQMYVRAKQVLGTKTKSLEAVVLMDYGRRVVAFGSNGAATSNATVYGMAERPAAVDWRDSHPSIDTLTFQLKANEPQIKLGVGALSISTIFAKPPKDSKQSKTTGYSGKLILSHGLISDGRLTWRDLSSAKEVRILGSDGGSYPTRRIETNGLAEEFLWTVNDGVSVRLSEPSAIKALQTLRDEKFRASDVRVLPLYNHPATDDLLRSQLPESTVLKSPRTDSGLRSALRAARDKVVIVIGHVEGDAFVVRQDGNKGQVLYRIRVADLDNWGLNVNASVLPLGCKIALAGDYSGPTEDLTSFETVDRVRHAMVDGTLKQFLTKLTEKFDNYASMDIVVGERFMKNARARVKVQLFRRVGLIATLLLTAASLVTDASVDESQPGS